MALQPPPAQAGALAGCGHADRAGSVGRSVPSTTREALDIGRAVGDQYHKVILDRCCDQLLYLGWIVEGPQEQGAPPCPPTAECHVPLQLTVCVQAGGERQSVQHLFPPAKIDVHAYRRELATARHDVVAQALRRTSAAHGWQVRSHRQAHNRRCPSSPVNARASTMVPKAASPFASRLPNRTWCERPSTRSITT